jgi:pimeloyl-ACP methyl ester carboxylesterase
MVQSRTVEMVDVGGLRVAVQGEGPADGRPVLLLHGGGQTRFAWGGTQRELGRRGYRAIAVDLRGHGDSDWAPDGDYSPASIAGDLLRLIRWTGGRPVLVGASLGGLSALIAAGENPELACSVLVLVDVTPRVNLAGARRVLAFMRSHPDGFGSLDEAADAVAAYLPHRPRPGVTTGLRRNLRPNGRGRLRWHWDPALVEFPDPDRPIPTDRLLAAARRVRVPTLLVRGALSDVVTDATAAELREVLRDAECVTVSSAGHMVAGDQNDAFTGVVVGFLEQAAPVARGDTRLRL